MDSQKIPTELAQLLESIKADFPRLLVDNLVGIYLWGSLTYDAFDPNHSDVDCIVVTKKSIDDHQFSQLDDWFAAAMRENAWTRELDMRFVIEGEFLDKSSSCCVFQFGKLNRTGSDGNPIIWLNIGQSGITLWGIDAGEVAPEINGDVLDNALLLEIQYLKEDLESNRGDRSQLAFKHNSYVVLTACRITYTAVNRSIVSKEKAYQWMINRIPPQWKKLVNTANKNRIRVIGKTTEQLEKEAAAFISFVEEDMVSALPLNRNAQ